MPNIIQGRRERHPLASFVVSQKEQLAGYNATLTKYEAELAVHKSKKIRLKEKYARLLKKEYPPKSLKK